MLIRCTSCDLQVSDKAFFCPHCGHPFKEGAIVTRSKRINKRRRLPNGFGQICEIKNANLRKPFRVMVNVGKTTDGKFISRLLKPEAFFATYNEAYAALLEYNRNPYDLDDTITVKQLYERWSEGYFESLNSSSSTRTITAAWKYCSSVYDMRVKDLRARHIKGCMEDGIANINGEDRSPSAGSKSRIKSMFNLMLDYAVEYELTDRNYARTFNVSDDIIKETADTKRGHIPFTESEIVTLWENINTKQYADVILLQCYSGWRPQELGLIRICDVDLDAGTMTGGLKTDAGKERVVPIHSKVRQIVETKYKEALAIGSEYLINCTDSRAGRRMTYDKYNKRFIKVMTELGLNSQHRAHDPRVHFITMAKKYKVDEYAIKYIVGHSIQDITERVYTKREVEWLHNEIEKIQ